MKSQHAWYGVVKTSTWYKEMYKIPNTTTIAAVTSKINSCSKFMSCAFHFSTSILKYSSNRLWIYLAFWLIKVFAVIIYGYDFELHIKFNLWLENLRNNNDHFTRVWEILNSKITRRSNAFKQTLLFPLPTEINFVAKGKNEGYCTCTDILLIWLLFTETKRLKFDLHW